MPAFLSSYFIQLYTGVVARQSFREFISGSQLQSLTQFNRKSNMQEDKCAERLVGIKAKIASISAMDPSLRGSIEEIEELKKKKPISLMPIIARRSENRTSQLQAEPIRPLSSEKKIFISDAVYYMNLHQKYERSALANINAPRNEVVPNEKMKESELSNEGKKEEGKEEVRRVTSNANQPASLFKLQPVIQESTIPEPQKETQTTKPVQQSQTAEIRETEQPQARSPVREIKDNKQKEGSLFNEPNSQEQIKPFFKPLAEAPKLNFFSNPPQNSLFAKAPDTASQLLFPVDKDKKMEIKPLGLFSQKPQPVNLSQVKADTIQQPQNVPKPTSTFLKVPQIGLNFPSQNESLKPPNFSFPPSNPQKIIFPSSQQAPATKLPLFSAGTPKLFEKEQEKQPQTTQPQQKKTRHLQGLFKNSQQVTPTNVPLNTNETQKPMTKLFGNSQQASQPLLFGGSLLPPPTNSSQFLSTAPKPTLGLFSSNSSSEKPATESKPPTFTPSFAPAKIEPVASPEIKTEGLFQKKTIFNELPATPVSQGGLFSNNNANNPPKEQPKPVVPQNNQSSLFQNKEPVAPIQQESEKAEKEEKKEKSNMFTVIGPGGKKLEMTSFSMGEPKKTNMFNSINNPTEVKNVFSQPSTLFQTSNSIFQQPNTVVPNAFSQPQPAAQTQNIFAKPINLFASTLFNPNQPKNGFGPAECQLFGKTGEIEEDQGDEGEDDGPLMDEDTANPNLSTGKFDYVKTQVHFKESAVKFREGTVKDNVIENITVSIQSFENSQDRYLHIRLANKCIAFTGMFLKDRTVSRSINNSDKNVEVSFILKIKDGVPAGGVLLRIQFKEESIGAKFLKEANAINATA